MTMFLCNKSFIFSVICSFIIIINTGCAFNKAQVNRPDLFDTNKKMFIYGHDDKADIYSTVKQNMIELGFNVVEDNSESDLTVDYNFNCGWDVFHYTCEKFILFVTDTKSNEIVFQSKFWGSTPLSASTLINNMFDKLEKEIEKSVAQQKNPPDKK